MGDLVIDDRHDRGGISNRRAQQGGTGWVQYLGTWDSWQNGTSCCRVSADHLRLLTVQMQAQFQPHTLNISRSCHMSSSTPSTKLVIQVPYIELWPQLGAEVMYGQIEKEGTQRMSLLYSLCRLKYIVMPKQWGWGIGRVDKRIQNWSQLTHSQQHLIPVQSWKCSWNLTSRSSGSHQGHRHTSKQREVLILHPPPYAKSDLLWFQEGGQFLPHFAHSNLCNKMAKGTAHCNGTNPPKSSCGGQSDWHQRRLLPPFH